MKKKARRIIASFAALALIAGTGFFANALVGNPVSRRLAENAAEKHLEENYSDTDFCIESVSFSFKDTRYYAHIKSPSSIDSHFTLYIDMLGNVEYDLYANSVLDGWNTSQRVNEEYRKLVDAVLDSPDFPYNCGIGFGEIDFISEEHADDPDVPSYALQMEDLEIDGIYDLGELGAQAGSLVLYINEDTITVERAAEIMLDIRRMMDGADISFRSMHFVLEYPRNGDGTRNVEDRIDIYSFCYEDIYEEGMVERVWAAIEAAEQYYAEQNKLKLGE